MILNFIVAIKRISKFEYKINEQLVDTIPSIICSNFLTSNKWDMIIESSEISKTKH